MGEKEMELMMHGLDTLADPLVGGVSVAPLMDTATAEYRHEHETGGLL